MSREKVNKQRLKNILKHKQEKKMETIKITNDTNNIDGLNFAPVEFWKPLITPLCQDFDLYACIPKALQVLRNKFGTWWINSAWRPNDNTAGPTAHIICPPAVDSQSAENWPVVMSQIREELKNWRNSELIQDMLSIGVNCIIIEGSCLHVHYRTEYNSHPDDSKWPDGIYLGEWQPESGNPNGINTIYSI